MTLFRRWFGGDKLPQGRDDANALWLYVQCGKCGTPLAVRVDTRNEVSTDYETGARILHKEMMDSVCFQLMYAEMQFDKKGKVTAQSVTGGKFITTEEYDSWRRAHGK